MRALCSRCGKDAAQRLVSSQRWFTLFFVPVFPFTTAYVCSCTYCGFAQKVTKETAKTIGAGPPATVPTPTATQPV